MKDPTLGEMRPLLSRIARVSVCMQETSQYENYLYMSDVPDEYDDLYIYGIGLIETEFYEGENFLDGSEDGRPMSECTPERPNLRFRDALEIVLSKEPRELPQP